MGYFRAMGPAVERDLPVEQALAGGAPQAGEVIPVLLGRTTMGMVTRSRTHPTDTGLSTFAATAEVLALRRVGKQRVEAIQVSSP